jgi:methylenetetrahydrofolate dehydrogenase (NADP+)/methenyltetrahydrofolate cyclohydrolase
MIDGRTIGAALREEIATEIAGRPARARRPGLATILVGADPASEVYVSSKHRACAEVGIQSIDERLPANCGEDVLAATIERLNEDDAVDGILLQRPLPAPLEADRFIDLIDPAKDVDGLTKANVGRLWLGRPGLAPCTPQGVIELLERSERKIEGREAVIVGRSALVGKPLAAMLLARNATVTVCHSCTSDLTARYREADILVAAVGVPEMLGADHVKPGATVIDVGINRRDDGLVGGC